MAIEATRTSAKPRGRRTTTSVVIHPSGERRITDRRIVHERCNISGQHDEFVFGGIVIDISKSGAGLIASDAIPIGAEIKLVIHGQRFEVELYAKVAWCAPLPSTNRVIKLNPLGWRMGLKFLPRNATEQNVILLLSAAL